MAIIHKDIATLAQQASINGSQKIPVTENFYVTFNMIKDWIERGLPAIYNANHDKVPSNDFDSLYSYQNDVWLCSHRMCNAPLDDDGNNNASYNTSFDNCVIQQFGLKDTNTKVQVLYITTGDVTNISMGYIFYRMQGDKWKRIATYSDIENLQGQINSLIGAVNNKQDKLSELQNINLNTNVNTLINPSANKVRYIHLIGQGGTNTITLSWFYSLDEFTMVINNTSGVVKVAINQDSRYKYVGVIPAWANHSWIITIWRGLIFANIIN